MATVVAVQRTLWESNDRVCRHIHFPAGSDTDVAATLMADVSAFTTGTTGLKFRIEKIWWSLSGFAVTLEEKATSNVPVITMAAGTGHLDFSEFHGIVNSGASGADGDLYHLTTGMADADDDNDDEIGFYVIQLIKDPLAL